MNKTILYTTDNALDESLALKCRELLLKACGDIPIVSVSQQPIDLGKNICVGDIGRNGLSMEYQLIKGLEEIDTQFVAIAEHDCVYSFDYFNNWNPPDDENFWYNDNCWLLQYHNPKYPELDGQYSFWGKRRVLSQMQANTKLYRKAVTERLEILQDPNWIKRNVNGRLGEPGAANFRNSMKICRHSDVRHLRQQIKDYLIAYAAKDWVSPIPNIDIRHGNNLTGPRRGNHRTFNLYPWGTMEELLS